MLPRGEEDLDSAFIVISGSVQIAFGHLGQYVLDAAQDAQRRKASSPDDAMRAGTIGNERATSACAGDAANAATLAHQQTTHRSDMQAALDACEAARRARAHSYLSPDALAAAMDAALSALRQPAWQLDAACKQDAGQQQRCAGRNINVPLAELRADPDALHQVARLQPGQMFAGPKLAAWGESKTPWPAPVQAQVAVATGGPFAAVLVIPKAAMLAIVRQMEREHIQGIVDECCRFPALRHLSVSQLARLAQFCTEKELPARHELLRQLHHSTHVYLLVSGSVELSAFTYVPEKQTLQADTLARNENYAADEQPRHLAQSADGPPAHGRWSKLVPKRPGDGVLHAVESTAGYMRFFLDGDGHKVCIAVVTALV